MSVFPKPIIAVSKCLGFDPCRYNGEVVQDKFVTRLEAHVEFVRVCPEVEIGLGTPRAPVRIVSSADGLRLIQPSSGFDVSERMRGFSRDFLDGLKNVDGFLLKNRSPSCGFTDVKFYSGPEKGPATGKTAGFFGGAVVEQFGDRAIEDEGRLKNLNIREHFLTRVFAFARFRAILKSASMHDQVRFHSAHKLLLMAYSQTKLRELGSVVANADGNRMGTVLEFYEKSFRAALQKTPRHGSPINVLMHTLGYFKKELCAREKRHFLELLEAYRLGRMPLSNAVSILRSWIIRFEMEYLYGQTFFNPFPEDLMALDDSSRGRA